MTSESLPPFPATTPERAALDSAVATCLDLNQALIETAVAIQQCEIDKRDDAWRVIENTLALAGALANLLHQLHTKRPELVPTSNPPTVAKVGEAFTDRPTTTPTPTTTTPATE